MRINLDQIKSFLVYDYAIPFSTRLAKQFFWPLYRYQVAVTGFNAYSLNVFEFFMLKFLSAENYSIKTLKKLTGMEDDLIDFLRQRLHHKGFLDENYYVTESGRMHIEDSNSEEAEPAFFYVYADPFTGALLPYIEAIENEQQITTDIVNSRRQFIEFKGNASLGKESEANTKKIWAFQFPKDRSGTAPSDHALRNIIRKTDKDDVRNTVDSPCGASIRLCNPNPDKVYLAVHFVLQNGNSSKWLITEGFSGDISALFAESLEKLTKDDQQEIQKLRNDLIKKMLNIPEKEARTLSPEQQKKLQPYYIYPEIYKKLKEIEKINTERLPFINSSDKQRMRNERVQKYIINLYEVLEWAFYHSASTATSVTSIRDDIKHLSPEEIKSRALAVTEHLHLPIDESDKKLFAVKYGSIAGCLKGQPQLIPLLVLHLLCAEHTPAGNFHALLKTEPKIITRLAWFKKKRDPAKHGEPVALTDQERSDAYSICYTTLEVLFPGTEGKKQQPALADNAEILVDTERARINRYAKAEKAAEERLGFAVQRRLPNALYTDIINIEKAFAADDKGDYDVSVVNNFYNLFDMLFCYLNANLPIADPFITAQKSLAKAARAGFRFTDNVTTLEAVNADRLEPASKNKKISLQASCLCFLFKAPDELLRQVSADCNQLVTAMNDLAGFRGHGDFINVTEEAKRDMQTQLPVFRELMYKFIHCIFSHSLI